MSSEWQPIETAPGDGYFLVCSMEANDLKWFDFETTVAVVWWNAAGRELMIHVDDDGKEWPYLDGPATHWRPLPELPK